VLPFIVENFTNGRALIPKMSYVNGLLPKPEFENNLVLH
jgi:hypothetical protein